jgi:hypothetical protein
LGGIRRGLRSIIRHFILNPAALIGWLIGLIVVIALIVAVPIFAPSIPVLANLRGASAPAATENYMRGNRDYNADLMWGSLNNDAQSRLRDQGGSVQDLQKQMETAKQHGIRLEEVSYIGGKALPDGTSMQFYLVGIRQADTIPDPANPATQIKNPNARSDIDYQPYMFTLDRDGKIAKVQ